MVKQIQPNLIINAVAYKDVEKAEDEPALANAINGEAPGVLAVQSKSIGAAIVHYSTDYIFDGTKPTAYVEDDEPNPLSAYGRSKLAGETAIRTTGVAHLIFRTSWLYGVRGRNFLLTILKLASTRQELRVVNDQVGAPTWSRSLAEATAKLLVKLDWSLPRNGETYHVTARGSTTWYDFAKRIVSRASDAKARLVRVVPVPSADFPTKAHRPSHSILSNDKLFRDFGIALPDWEQDLTRVISSLDHE